MKIILLDNVKNLGSIGAQVEVKSGYARNYLIPQSKAVLATDRNIVIFQQKQKILQSKVIEKQKQAELYAKKISDIGNIDFVERSSIDGKLFGSVGSRDIAESITKLVGLKILKNQIQLPKNDILKFVGIYKIKVHIYSDIYARLNVTILSRSE